RTSTTDDSLLSTKMLFSFAWGKEDGAMKAFSFAALITVICLGSALMMARAAGAEKDDLQRVWRDTSMESNRKQNAPNEVERTRFTFKGQKLLVRHSKGEGKEEGTFKADPKRSPKHLDIMIKNKTLHGIYEVKGDELKVCYETGGKRENRPTKFAT